MYEYVRTQFTERQLADLTLAIAAINAWNRLSIAGRTTPGTYQQRRRRQRGVRDHPAECL